MLRKSPTQSATLYKVGTKKIGNDGNRWIIVSTATGVHRWQLFKKLNEQPAKKSKVTNTSKKNSKKNSKNNSKKNSKKTIVVKRKSPINKAENFEIGKKQIGVDGNTWIVAEMANGIKKWKLHRKSSTVGKIKYRTKKQKDGTIKKFPITNDDDVEPISTYINKNSKKYINPEKYISNEYEKNKKIKLNIFDGTTELKDEQHIFSNIKGREKECIEQLRNSYNTLAKKTGITICESFLPKNKYGYYVPENAVNDLQNKYPKIENIPYIQIIFALDDSGKVGLFFDFLNGHHDRIDGQIKKKFIEFIETFNKKKLCKINWNGNIDKAIKFYIK